MRRTPSGYCFPGEPGSLCLIMGWLFVLGAAVFATLALGWVHFVCKLIREGQPTNPGELKRNDCPWTRFEQEAARELESSSPQAKPLPDFESDEHAEGTRELKRIGDMYKLDKAPGADVQQGAA